jgi:uncharacterized protein (TIGR02466 family)
MQQDHDVLTLFPIPLYVGLIEGGILPQEIEFAQNLEYDPNTGGNMSSHNHYVLGEPAMARLRRIADRHLDTFRQHVLATDNELYITQSWTNRNSRGSHHHSHNHLNSIVSGVMYFTHGGSVPPIVFKSDRRPQILPRQTAGNIFNTDTFSFRPQGPVMLIFPSSIDHAVATNATDEERISLAFNTFLRGDLGVEERLNRLKI